MMNKMTRWFNENEDTLMQVFGFGFAIILALGMISVGAILMYTNGGY